MDSNLHPISDMYLYAFLRSRGHEYKDLIHKNGKIWFLFDNSDAVKDDEKAFINGAIIEFNPRELVNSIKDAKTLTYQLKFKYE